MNIPQSAPIIGLIILMIVVFVTGLLLLQSYIEKLENEEQEYYQIQWECDNYKLLNKSHHPLNLTCKELEHYIENHQIITSENQRMTSYGGLFTSPKYEVVVKQTKGLTIKVLKYQEIRHHSCEWYDEYNKTVNTYYSYDEFVFEYGEKCL